MLLEYARGVAARANAYDMCGARKKQPGRQKGREKMRSILSERTMGAVVGAPRRLDAQEVESKGKDK